eukprot:scaffold253315_cov35-Tisochrysis_lutea.AAC.3
MTALADTWLFLSSPVRRRCSIASAGDYLARQDKLAMRPSPCAMTPSANSPLKRARKYVEAPDAKSSRWAYTSATCAPIPLVVCTGTRKATSAIHREPTSDARWGARCDWLRGGGGSKGARRSTVGSVYAQRSLK